MVSKLKKLPAINVEYVFTMVVGFVALVGQFIAIKLAANFLNHVEVSQFLVGRRALSFIEPLASFGMGVAIPKFMSQGENRYQSDSYFLTGFIVIIIMSLFMTCGANIFATKFSLLFFGTQTLAYLTEPLMFLLLGSVLLYAYFSYFRGYQRLYLASIIRFLQIAIIPIAAILLITPKTLEQIWYLTALFMVIVALITSFFVRLTPKFSFIKSDGKKLLIFGSQRFPANFVTMAFFTLPVIFMTHLAGIKEAGSFTFAIVIINSISYIFSLIDIILLPYAGKMFVKENFEKLYSVICVLLFCIVIVTTFLVVMVEIFTPLIVQKMLNLVDRDTINIIRLTIPAAIPYSIFLSLRGVIDSQYEKAKVSFYLGFSFVVFLVLAGISLYFDFNKIGIIFPFVFGLYLLGCLVVIDVLKIGKK